MVGQQILDLPIGVRVPAPQLSNLRATRKLANPSVLQAEAARFDPEVAYYAHVDQRQESLVLETRQ
jgi:hypothetical protein